LLNLIFMSAALSWWAKDNNANNNSGNEITCFLIEDRPANMIHRHTFFSCDLDIDPMTLKYELDLNILKINLLTRNEHSSSGLLKVRALQAHRQCEQKHHDAAHIYIPACRRTFIGGGITGQVSLLSAIIR